MGLLLILPILVSGYIYCNSSFYRQATISKYEGQLLYLLVAKIGLFLFLAGSIISFALIYASKHSGALSIPCLGWTDPFDADYIKYVKAYLIRNEVASPASAALWVFFGQTSAIALFASNPLGKVYVYFVKKRQRLDTVDQAKAFILNEAPGSLFTKRLLASMHESQQYMFSMSDRKVYVGRVASVGDPHETAGIDEEFAIVPTMSGYRDKDSLAVTYNTDYSAVVEELSQNGRATDFSIILSQENLVSMSRFEMDIWARFKARQQQASDNPS